MKWILIGVIVGAVVVCSLIFGFCKAAARGDRKTEEAVRKEKEKEK